MIAILVIVVIVTVIDVVIVVDGFQRVFVEVWNPESRGVQERGNMHEESVQSAMLSFVLEVARQLLFLLYTGKDLRTVDSSRLSQSLRSSPHEAIATTSSLTSPSFEAGGGRLILSCESSEAPCPDVFSSPPPRY